MRTHQGREHRGKVCSLEASPGLFQDLPALGLVAYAAHARLRETSPKNVLPNHLERPMSCATFPILEGFFIDPPYPMVSVTGLPRRTLRRLRYGLTLGASPTARNATRR